ncbi:MAG: lipocalin-like domain-containing protein [Xanthomonadaceae bacterium]|nr:lipocalin-like domain-containing protein [Xanthomonadaceae bacterium]
MTQSVIGTWKLVAFNIEDNEKQITPWGKDTHGLLIYTDSGHVSVSINKKVENDSENEFENKFDSVLFYSGTYRVEGNTIKHQVTQASNPARIGREMIRYAEFKGDEVTLVTPQESFGRAILIWKRI